MMKRFFLYIFIFSILVYAVGYFAVLKFGNPVLAEADLFNFTFFLLVTVISYPLLAHSLVSNPKSFNNLLFGGIALKMVLSLVFILLFISRFEDSKITFVLSFFASYILFTGFEVYLLLLNLRQISEAHKNAEKPDAVG
ncbi:MAG: hypothetical protein WD077_16090 [Bacteroidia bacterium]